MPDLISALPPVQEVPLRAVRFDVTTPLDYWRRGASFVPDDAAARVQRFDLYRELFHGDFGRINADEDRLVQFNYFRRAAVFLADLLTSFPPVVEGVDGLDGAFADQLNDAIHRVVVDRVRFGTGCLRAAARDGVPEVHAVDPAFWYPIRGYAGDVLAYPVEGEVEGDYQLVYLLPGGGRAERWSNSGGALGELRERVDFDMPGERTLISCPRRPRVGEWGTPLYDDMVPLVAELNRRVAGTSRTLTRHASPLLEAKRARGQPGPYPDEDDVEAEIRLKTERVHLTDQRESGVVFLGGDYDEVRYLVWDAQLQAAFAHCENVLEGLFAVTQVPGPLYGMWRGGSNSGMALKRAFTPTYVYLRSEQAYLLPRLERVIRLAVEMAGGDGSAISVSWDNPFDALDTMTVVQTSTEGGGPEPARIGAA